jgi:hypothetical protein
VGLKRGQFSLVMINEELRERKYSGWSLETRDLTAEGVRRADNTTPLYQQNLTLNVPRPVPVAQSV